LDSLYNINDRGVPNIPLLVAYLLIPEGLLEVVFFVGVPWVIEIKISKKIESRNFYDSKHWSVKHKDRKQFESQIVKQLLLNYSHKERQAAQKRVKRSVTIHSQRSRLLDYTNLVGGCKQLEDALVSLGLLVDDKPAWVEDLKVTQATGKPYFTEIIIE